MPTLSELSSENHKDIKLTDDAIKSFVAKQHVVNLEAVEVAHAATCYPIFVTRDSLRGHWTISAMTSFAVEFNVFSENGEWATMYTPNCVRIYPLHLMSKPGSETEYTIGIDEESSAFSTEQGTSLFNEDGKASQLLSEKTQLLQANLQEMKQTYLFLNSLEEHGLLKPLDLSVDYQNGENSKITGLHTIDEDKLKLLTGDQLKTLNDQGYLTPIYALLISLSQVNQLITKHNKLPESPKIVSVKLEVSKDTTQS